MTPQIEAERQFMEGDLDAFDYILAERLGYTVEELLDRISNLEYIRWRAFYTYRQGMRELAAAKGARGGR